MAARRKSPAPGKAAPKGRGSAKKGTTKRAKPKAAKPKPPARGGRTKTKPASRRIRKPTNSGAATSAATAQAAPAPMPTPAQSSAPSHAPAGATKTVQVEDDGLVVVAPRSKMSIEELAKVLAPLAPKSQTDALRLDLDRLKYDAKGHVTVVAQDRVTGAIVGIARSDRAALEATLKSGRLEYVKGERVAGAQGKVRTLRADCDGDAVLAVVDGEGAHCDKEAAGCFTEGDELTVANQLGELDGLIARRKKEPVPGSELNRMISDRATTMHSIIEDAGRLVGALRGTDDERSIEARIADLWLHVMVAGQANDVRLVDVLRELKGRRL